ncbi:MAG TPA: CRISPR-associated endonuclease Cas2 [Chloroflexota bacterium]|nr:CRISPR-associated endonuclease Cas2 [Chloroflexota bacterium]
MRCLVVYDIVVDRVRARVAEACLDYGLQRIQYSAFLGDLSHNRQAELLLRVRRELGRTEGHVALFPLCDPDFRARREVRTG